MELSVSTLSIIMMVISMLVSIIVPWVLFGILWKKYKCSPAAFFVGAGVMFVFAFVLEQVMHTIVLSMPGVGSTIQENIFLYGLYGGLAAGVFDKLLQKGDYTRKRKSKKTRNEVIHEIYWSLVTAVYLGVSFWTMKWHITWIIWPVAAVAGAVLDGILRLCCGEEEEE